MLKRTMLATLAACALLAGVALQAQQSATVVLRSGERVQGQLVDLGADYTLQVNGQERRIAPGDVAAIEFAGGAQLNSDWYSKLSSGQPIVVLRNGETFAGRLADIHGAGSGQYTIDTPSGRREVAGGDVAQIYFSVPAGMAASNNAVATSGVQGTQLESGAISIPANQGWVNTGITVRKGQMINFRVNGEIQLSGDGNDRAMSAGSSTGRHAAGGAPLPGVLAGALIGRVGNGPAFGIGNQASVSMPANGVLFLGINDDTLSDNTGNFSVVLSR
jgi:hypothetical protein